MLGRKLRQLLIGFMACCIALVSASSASAASYIVSVSEGISPAAVADAAGVDATFTYDSAFNGFAADLTPTQLSRIQNDGRVVSFQLDGVSTYTDRKSTNLPAGHPAQLSSYGADRIGLLESRTASVDGSGKNLDVDVAVLDGGVDKNHKDLRVAGGIDCVDGRSYDDQDEFGHGTLVAGIIAAKDNAYGYVGIAPGARVWAVRVASPDGVIEDSAALCGIEWVIENASRIEVANMSFGDTREVVGNCGLNDNGEIEDPFHAAICRAHDAGVTLVAAAGNEALPASTSIPASYPEVISVAAFTETDGIKGAKGPEAWCEPGERDDFLATFSNYGPDADFAAPGVCIPSTYFDGFYAASSGTSFAAPHVAGAAALIKVKSRSATPSQVLAKLNRNASRDRLRGIPDGYQIPIVDVRNF